MAQDRPLILVTNDDGFDFVGIRAAASAAAKIGDVLIAAPMEPHSWMSCSYPQHESVGVIAEKQMELSNGQTVTGYAVGGSPAQSAAYALTELVPRLPDLCISGVNWGPNLGLLMRASGTLGAAVEASTWGIPSLAISLDRDFDSEPDEVDWTASEHFAEVVLRQILKHGLPSNVSVANCNVPRNATPSTSIRRTETSEANYVYFGPPVRESRDHPAALPVMVDMDVELEPNSDVHAVLVDKVVSVSLVSKRLSTDVEWKGLPDL